MDLELFPGTEQFLPMLFNSFSSTLCIGNGPGSHSHIRSRNCWESAGQRRPKWGKGSPSPLGCVDDSVPKAMA